MLEQKYHNAFHSLQLACSLYNYSWQSLSNSQLLRIWRKCCESFRLRYGDSLDHMFEFLYKAAKPEGNVNHLRGYKTLSMYACIFLRAPSEIWNMPYVRHVTMLTEEVMDDVYCDGDDTVLGKLQTIKVVTNFNCSEEIVKRIHSLKKLTTECNSFLESWEESSFSLSNIGRLDKLESFVVSFFPGRRRMYQNLTFPNSLKKLSLQRFYADDELLRKIGSLPSLVKLKLRQGCFDGKEWATVEGHFRSLRFLFIKECYGFESWKTESTHFPCLECLTLEFLPNLDEIPLDIGEIPMLVSLEVVGCRESVADSAIKIQEEQEEQGNEGLRVQIKKRRYLEHLRRQLELPRRLEQEFLEGHSHDRRNTNIELPDGLENRITDAARKAEDVIESRLVDQILAGTASRLENKFYKYLQRAVRRIFVAGSTGDEGARKFHESLQTVLEGMELIKHDVIEIQEATATSLISVHPTPRGPVRSSFNEQKVVVGFDDELIEMLDKLTSDESMRQVIPVVGMSGIGKTTLARTVYSNQIIQRHFDACAWTAISQHYCVREILVHVLSQITKVDREDLLEKSDNDLKVELHKFLMSRRYFIVLDDIWDIEVWEEIQLLFPDCSNRSRIVVTTRLSNLALKLNDSYFLKMKLLDEDGSWNLFCNVVFGEDNFPLDELEEIGKKIARGCKGLPLSICVVGGLLAKSKNDLEYWKSIVTNVTSVVNLEDNERCLRILHLSYIQLPTYLKPCFLYMGVFPKDEKIRVSKVIELWVYEGFLKPIGGKSSEVVAKEYFSELIDRNLISIHSLGSTGAIKYCNIHDLLRDFCLRQAQKERFEDVLELHNLNSPQGRDNQCGSVSDDWRFILEEKYHDSFRSLQLACSLYYYSWQHHLAPNSRLLRIWTKCRGSFFFRHGDYLEKMFLWKYYAAEPQGIVGLFPSTHTFWNFKTLNMYASMVLMVPSQIWNMPHLRHVRIKNLELPDPPHGDKFVLENLLTLSRIKDFKCSEEIIKRIPNIKKLHIAYTCRYDNQEASLHLLHNIGRLRTLESLNVSFVSSPVFWQKLTFPNLLMKLTITRFSADQVLDKIGSLPFLVKLKLIQGFFDQREWVTVEGQFLSLKYLLIKDCFQLEHWKTESAHFPRLESLTLHYVRELEEIPLDIGEISTLASINVKWCSYSVVDSANKILLEQEKLGNECLEVRFQP